MLVSGRVLVSFQARSSQALEDLGISSKLTVIIVDYTLGSSHQEFQVIVPKMEVLNLIRHWFSLT